MKMRADCSRTSQVLSRAFALMECRADQAHPQAEDASQAPIA
jgi:hypothetical protein